MQGEHQLAAQPLAQRVLSDQSFELGDGAVAQRQLRVHELLVRREP